MAQVTPRDSCATLYCSSRSIAIGWSPRVLLRSTWRAPYHTPLMRTQKRRRGCASLCRLDHRNDGRPMSTAEYFKEQAERCRRLAQRAASPVVARELLELAADFLRRATELESSGSPVAQQQQQIQPKQDDE
jgi:hypothetical protein